MIIQIFIIIAMMGGSAAIGYKVANRNAENVLIDTEIEKYAQGFSDGLRANGKPMRKDTFKENNPGCYDGEEFMMTDSCLEKWELSQDPDKATP